jgi:hypothetical protein
MTGAHVTIAKEGIERELGALLRPEAPVNPLSQEAACAAWPRDFGKGTAGIGFPRGKPGVALPAILLAPSRNNRKTEPGSGMTPPSERVAVPGHERLRSTLRR